MAKKVSTIRATVAVIAARISEKMCKLTKTGGTSFPGVVALKICPNILDRVSEGVETVYVLGTNGKSTTTKMSYYLLRKAGLSVFYNQTGANMRQGLVATYIKNASITGKPKYKIGVIECDELYFGPMSKILPPKVVVVNNLFEDQTDRLGSPEKVCAGFQKILEGMDTTVCVNTDCEVLLPLLEVDTGHKPISFCVKDGQPCVDGEMYEVKLNIPGEYNVANSAAASSVAKAFGVLSNDVLKILSKMTLPFGRMEVFEIGGKTATMNLIKNPAGINLTIDYFIMSGKKYNLILGINNQVADGEDVSWIEKAEFEKTVDIFDKVYLFGDCIDEMKERIAKAGFADSDVTVLKDTAALVSVAKSSDKDIAILNNYTCMMTIRKAFQNEGLITQYWKK